MATNFLPSRDAELLSWAINFTTLIGATPTDYGLDAAQATAYNTLTEQYRTALQTSLEPSSRTPESIEAKRVAKAALNEESRELARIVQATPTVTSIQKVALGLTVRDVEPTPVPAPTEPPGLDVVSSVARTVKIRLHDVKTNSRAKPEGVRGAAIFSFVGDEPPDNIKDWAFVGNTSKTVYDVVFDSSVVSGSTVWVTAYWFNTKSVSGPASQPVTINIPGGLSQAA